MHAMQYAITLPADYDMQIIHRRVAAGAATLDDLPGLGLKAYCVRERGADGSPFNQYAPFYLWNDPSAMNRFLYGGGGFDRIVQSFGRPAVAHWSVLAYGPGPEHGAGRAPRAATLHAETLAPDQRPEDAVADALDALADAAKQPGVHAAALAVDPHAWQLVRFTLWDQAAAPEAPGTRYTVLRVNTPEQHLLPTGRPW